MKIVNSNIDLAVGYSDKLLEEIAADSSEETR